MLSETLIIKLISISLFKTLETDSTKLRADRPNIPAAVKLGSKKLDSPEF